MKLEGVEKLIMAVPDFGMDGSRRRMVRKTT